MADIARKFGGTTVLGSGVATAVARGLSQLAQLAVLIVAARYLTPEQFGVFALVSAFAVIALQFSEAGWSELIISWSDTEETIREITLVAWLTGLAIGALGIGAALIANALDAAHPIAQLIALFSVWIFLSTVAATQSGILIRRERVVYWAGFQICGDLAGLVTAIALLHRGHDVTALIWGRLVQQTLLVGGALTVSRLFPAARVGRETAIYIVRFYGSVLATRVLATLRSYVATIFIGMFLGLASAGLYRAADRLIGAISELIVDPVRVIAWVVFRRAATRASAAGRPASEGLRESANTFLPIILAVATPAFFLVGWFSTELVAFVFGDRWKEAGLIMAILAASRLLFIPSSVTLILLSLVGEVRRLPPISLLNCLVAIALVFATAHFGPAAVALGEVGAGVVAIATSIYLQARYAGIDWRTILLRSVFIVPTLVLGLLGGIGLTSVIARLGWPDIMTAALASLCALAIYALCVALVRPRVVRNAAHHIGGRS
ncbi:oligosaccharide flippase family protein [Acuticoccus sp. M5D2P5]|uniref:oligosaccharide flippase family protein n=1 Tax=Acuticoccus kalidii TaxID=2910977 RepID=UPI001F2015B3|nr:oligosaccharide flippase family protein [Acuticoccus kalidii]MCF3935162.1 oligosaccharide flippase family protein [Acuticoccus kalidii]